MLFLQKYNAQPRKIKTKPPRTPPIIPPRRVALLVSPEVPAEGCSPVGLEFTLLEVDVCATPNDVTGTIVLGSASGVDVALDNCTVTVDNTVTTGPVVVPARGAPTMK